MKKKWIIAATLIVSLLFVRMAMAAPNAHSIAWWIIGGGGGSTTVGNTSLDSTLGQWVVGSDESDDLQLGPGFWGGGWDENHVIYLPVVLRNLP